MHTTVVRTEKKERKKFSFYYSRDLLGWLFEI